MDSHVIRSGEQFGRLTAISYAGLNGCRQRTWLCKCFCGAKATIREWNLHVGHTRSCGCLRRRTVHGALRSGKRAPEYISWIAAKSRCNNPNVTDYALYGGRGINMCEEWDKSFVAFRAHMGPRPKGTSLDRIDTNGNYEPGNCRWADAKTQTNNRRTTGDLC